MMGLLLSGIAYAEDQAPAVTAGTESPAAAAAESAPVAPAVAAPETTAPAVVAVPAAEVPAASAPASENLEFISGEISSLDEAAKTITVKLYGETDNKTSDKILTIKVDSTTDITDGEQDRALKSLAAGTEVDVEYDPATNKATYIFVY